ncbi:MAG TPA: hypothetical protein VNA32_02580, partial [Actinomycetota bacterium]|nr:hypothetical protein [Actinomycetota bacterium]
MLWRTPVGAAAGSGAAADPAVERGGTGATDSGGTAQAGSPSWLGTSRVPHEVQEVRAASLSVPHQAQRVVST